MDKIVVKAKKLNQPNLTTMYPESAGKIDLEKPIIEVKKEYWVALNLPSHKEAIKAM